MSDAERLLAKANSDALARLLRRIADLEDALRNLIDWVDCGPLPDVDDPLGEARAVLEKGTTT